VFRGGIVTPGIDSCITNGIAELEELNNITFFFLYKHRGSTTASNKCKIIKKFKRFA
jgi:hypothetical protein